MSDLEAILPICRVSAKLIRPRVLVVGDPARARLVAEVCEDSKLIGSNREYLTFDAVWNNTPITIASHGVGACGAAVAFEEFCRAGAKKIIRCGTAGGLQENIDPGDLVVATAAIRADGLSQRIVPLEYPAVADPMVTCELEQEARKLDESVHVGVVATQASFYPSMVFDNEQYTWKKTGAKAVEMEIAALYTICGMHEVKCGAVVAIDGNPIKMQDESMENYAPENNVVTNAIDQALKCALNALVK